MEDVAAEAGVTRLILYRHFGSKEELYRAVLELVSNSLRDRFVAGLNNPQRRSFVVRSLLEVAREHPDGFRLLWVHATREPDFADYAREHRQRADMAADLLLGSAIPDWTLRRWATHALVGVLTEVVLSWIDEGDPERDDEFVEIATAGLRALVGAIAVGAT